MFINDKDVRYEHRIHEQIYWSLIKKYGQNSISNLNALIYHSGYDLSSENMKIKRKINFDILSSYKEDEKDDYYNYLIGRHYFDEYDFEKALVYIEKALENPNKVIGQVSYLRLARAFCLVNFKMYNKALLEINNMKKEYKDFKDLYYTEYLIYKSCGLKNESLRSLKVYKNINNDNRLYPNLYYVTNEELLKRFNELIM